MKDDENIYEKVIKGAYQSMMKRNIIFIDKYEIYKVIKLVYTLLS